jgi:hypothetical protein
MVFLHSLADVLTLLWYHSLPATELGNTRQYNTCYGWRQYLVADGGKGEVVLCWIGPQCRDRRGDSHRCRDVLHCVTPCIKQRVFRSVCMG